MYTTCPAITLYISQPGVSVQVSKMGKLVEDLRRQESGYLGILLKMLVSAASYAIESPLTLVSAAGPSLA